MPREEVEAFVRGVREYCKFVDGAAALSISERADAARRLLLTLYTSALSLPQVECTDRDAADVEMPGNWPGFGELEFYWEVFDPYEASEPVTGSLSDDVLDVYRDLRRGLALWDASHRADAIWEWRFHFNAHWGDHAVNALRALHRAITDRWPS